jgi:uncharacterized repeat protein (TIGR01451 family)
MKLAFLRQALLVAGLALVLTAIIPGGAGQSLAAPHLIITDTSTAEPPSPTATNTPVPTDTPVGPSSTPTNTPTGPAPTATPGGPTVTPGGPTVTPGGPTATPGGPTNTPTSPPATTPFPTDEPPERPRASETPTTAPSATNTPIPLPGPDISLTKQVVGSTTVRVGDTVEYRITVTNTGGQPVNDLVVTDDLPAFLELISASASRGQVEVSGSSVVVTIGILAPGEQVTITITARVARYALPSESGNVAVARSSDPLDPAGNNESQVGLVIEPPASPTPSGPAALPTTGPGSDGGLQLGLLALGLALIAASLLIRQRGAAR